MDNIINPGPTFSSELLQLKRLFLGQPNAAD